MVHYNSEPRTQAMVNLRSVLWASQQHCPPDTYGLALVGSDGRDNLAEFYYGPIKKLEWNDQDTASILACIMAHEVAQLLGTKHSAASETQNYLQLEQRYLQLKHNSSRKTRSGA